MTGLVVLVSLAAALAFGWSTAAMHWDASRTPASVQGPVALLRHLAGQWRWLTGMLASLLGLALHAVALRMGSLAVVQPLVVTGLLFSLVFRAALDRQRLSRTATTWACVTAAGLAVFLVAAGSATGADHPDGRAAAVLLGVGVVVAVLAFSAGTRAAPGLGGLLLGAGTGVNFGLTAGTLKATSGAPSLLAAVTDWPLYVLVVLGVSGFLANQVAYRRAPLAASLPILNVVNPLVALLYGVVVFAERPADSPLALLVEVLSLGVVLVAVFVLAREGAVEPDDARVPVQERVSP